MVGDGQVQWVYDTNDVHPGLRTDKLVALLFVGKVTSKSKLETTLEDPDQSESCRVTRNGDAVTGCGMP